ncbi:MAG: MltA domain-containing protein [Pseudomonadota bacterium]
MSDTDTSAAVAHEAPEFVRLGWDDLPGWQDDDHGAAFQAFLTTAKRAATKPYKTRTLGVDGARLRDIGNVAIELGDVSSDAARRFFEEHFEPYRLDVTLGGHLTGYYEPVVSASRERTPTHTFPILRRPDDLVDLDETNRPVHLADHIRFGRRLPDGSVDAYFERSEIEGDGAHNGVLANRGLELAWVEDPMDAYFVHIQGSARLALTDGSEMRITYAAKSGHDYSSIGKALLAKAELASDDLTMASLRRWFRDNSERRTHITWLNRSYIFFEEVQIDDPALGPIAEAKVPLSPGRSLAVDRTLHTYGTPIFVMADGSDRVLQGSSNRLVIAQDTGSAIVGPARGDLFVGTGDAAGELAGAINCPARFVVLMPREV